MVALSRGRSSDGDAMMLIPPTPLPCCPSAPLCENTTLQHYRLPRVMQCVTRQQVMEQSRPRSNILLEPSPMLLKHPALPGISARWLMLEIVFGEASAALLLPRPSSMLVGSSLVIGFAGKIESRRTDSNRLPLLITSVRSGVAERCRSLQIPHR